WRKLISSSGARKYRTEAPAGCSFTSACPFMVRSVSTYMCVGATSSWPRLQPSESHWPEPRQGGFSRSDHRAGAFAPHVVRMTVPPPAAARRHGRDECPIGGDSQQPCLARRGSVHEGRLAPPFLPQ